MDTDTVLTSLKPYIISTYNDGEIPSEIYIAFRNSNIDKIKKMWKNCIDPLSLTRSTLRGEAEIVCKPNQIYVKSSRNSTYFVFELNSGKIYAPVDMFNDDMFDALHEEMLYFVVQRRGNVYYATEVKPLISNEKKELGKEFYEYLSVNGIPFTSAIAVAYGYAPSYPIDFLTFVRSLTLYKVAGNAIHAFELSLPNTGKTTFGIRNQFAFNWAYVDEVPSYARLIMDARNGAIGLVFRSNGIFIDEIDKYNINMKEIVQAMLTGMSHGVWTRAKGDKSAPQLVRKIPIYLSGNINVQSLDYKYTFVNTLRQLKLNDSMIDALMDRIGVLIIGTSKVNASDKVINYVIPDSYLRGLIAYMNDLANKHYKDYGIGEGRKRMQYNQIRTILELTLCYEYDCEKKDYADTIVNGVVI